jgi:hypothetical protein
MLKMLSFLGIMVLGTPLCWGPSNLELLQKMLQGENYGWLGSIATCATMELACLLAFCFAIL